MRSCPRARIALNSEPLLPKLLQAVEARRKKKRCHEASDTISCTHEGDGRHVKGRSEGMRGSAGHMDTMCRSPVHRMEASQVVRWELRKLLSCSRQPSQPRLGLLLQAREGCAGARLF